MDLNGKKVLVIGTGVSGIAATGLLVECGATLAFSLCRPMSCPIMNRWMTGMPR